MDLLRDKIRPLYFRYLAAAFGSALISSVYGIVDLAMVGKYQGAEGTAAISLISPVWNILYSLGLLVGIGGAVLFSALRGESPDNIRKSNEYFTAAAGGGALALISWLGLIFFDRQLLLLFGANEALMPLARAYLFPIKFGVPLFIFNQLLSAFLRNDGDPALATKAVLFGGIFNVFGDYFCIFTLDMGIMGAGLATVVGSFFSLIIMLTHFFGKKNTLALVRPQHFFRKLREIGSTGFSTFFIDVAMGILTIFFNRQVLRYFDTNALAVYGILAYVGTFAQCCAYSAGQAAQPIISVNFGAGDGRRIRQTLRYALITIACFGVFWAGLSLAAPNLYIRLLTTPTAELLSIAPTIIRRYGLSFLLLPLNIFSTYYFQALLKRGTSFIVSVARGAVISGILIYLLPAACGADAIWFAMPITELIVAVYAGVKIKQYTKQLPTERTE
ncbi:MAG: MATE family efflux transporter [Oscillospiraceae bacterium]|nr:MATE family efflux transporter [Oscillospiraceae bacterium]